MAFIKSHTDERDVNYVDSYWRVLDIHINVKTKTANFTFEGYKDKIARDAGKQPIGHRNYSINDLEFDKYFADEMKKIKNIREICYEWAKLKKDLPTGEFITVDVNTPNAHTVTVLKSFFEDAVDDLI